MLHREKEFHVVTSRDEKVSAWRDVLGPNTKKSHARFFEQLIHLSAPEPPIKRVVHIVREKNALDRAAWESDGRAAFDSAYLHTGLAHTQEHHLMPDININDLIQPQVTRITVDTVMAKFRPKSQNPPSLRDDERAIAIERPESVEAWLADVKTGAMAQAGAKIELVAGVFLEDWKRNSTYLILRSRMQGRNYTRAEVDKWLLHTDPDLITKTAGGFSFFDPTSHFIYDQTVPIEIFLQPSLEERPVHLESLPWSDLTGDIAMQLVYGVRPELTAEASTRLPGVFSPNGTVYSG